MDECNAGGDAAPIKDTDFDGTVEHCYMCGSDYIHPHGAVAGLGKCHDCFMLLWRNAMDEPEDA